ncbi:hypothetical protein [Bergeyella zoohelcum]|uniref:hypothetical protein n=1 Tax=Bergeyella zoohelcum TaxID=1015 RepID=UPI0015F116FE|nr:hypothetical protein [Bergeyella zoohelcum]
MLFSSVLSAYNDNDFFSTIKNNPTTETDKETGKAIGAFSELDKSNRYVERINPNELTEFPIGIKENKSNVEYSIVVTKAVFTPEYALINAYARISTPQMGAEGEKKTLYFGAEGIKLSYGGRIIGDAKLSLLGNIHIPFNQNQWLLTLEGGKINKNTGESVNDNIYVVMDCDGVKELSLKGNVQISRNVLVPINGNGDIDNNPKNRVRGDFAIKASDWNDILVKVSLTPFAITAQTQSQDKGYFSFFVNNAVLDLSDLRTAPEVVFPQYYEQQGYLIAGKESWRGLYVQSLHVGLPEEFKTTEHTNSKISFEAQNLLIDTYGVSGNFSANNLISLDKGITSSQNAWRYSVDKIGVDFAASKIVGANLKGKIQLPLQKDNNENSDASYLGYEGVITDDEYLISVNTIETLQFDLWSAKATINPGSSIEMRVKNRTFLPKAILNGNLSISANTSAKDKNSKDKKDAEFKGIVFEGLTLQTEAPFITAQYFGVQGEQKLVGFPASIKNIYIEADQSYANLGFEVSVGLQESRFSASGGMVIKGIITNDNNRMNWKYDGFTLSKLGLKNVDIGVASVSGELEIMNDDPLYGNGFRSNLKAQINSLNITIDVNAIYGFSTFRYWGFEGSVKDLNINASVLTITGFTGGAFYRMIPDAERTIHSAHKDKALVLKPDESVGLALRAGIYGKVGSEKAANIMAGFNISTNKNGGIANMGFIGEAVIMSDFSALVPEGAFAGIQKKFKKMIGNDKFLNELKDNDRVKNFLDTQKVDEQYPVAEKIEGSIYGKLAMNYDFNNRIFHSNLDVYVNVANGIIKGIGQNGRAGWAVLHIAPDDWYMHIGTPTDMIGLRVGFGSFLVQSGSYFMVGNHIPGSPPPPSEVAQILGVQLEDIDYMKDLNSLGEGKGFAFGTHLKFDTGDMTALFLYARFQAGLGTDIMLKNYGEAKCSNRSGSNIGINGWYANGQAYVYLQGELGIKIKLWFVNKKIPIIKAGAAALLQAKGPNPYWARGYIGGHYNLLGGLVKGSFRFKLEFGEECQLANSSVLGGMKIISDLTPEKNSKDVNVFAIPQATLSVKANEPIVIPEDDGDHTYKVIVDKMTIVDEQGKEIKGRIEYATSKDVINFVSDDILPPNKTLKALIQVSFMEKKRGMYEVVNVNGQKAIEIEERTFTTGTAPTNIPLHNIEYAYPVVNQENYYKGETNKGYIKLKRGQDYLFEDNVWVTSSQFASGKKEQPSDFNYNESDNIIRFAIPELSNEKEYTFSIVAKNNQTAASNKQENKVAVNQVSGEEDGDSSVTANITTKAAQNTTKDGNIERLAYQFKTSKYNTFSQKIKALNFNPLWLKISSDVVALQNNMNANEYFESAELVGSAYTANQPMIELTATMEDTFAQQFKSLIYDVYPVDGMTLMRANDSENNAGIPPIKGFSVFPSYLQFLGSDKGHRMLTEVFPYTYDLFKYYKSDWYELVSKAANKYINIPAVNRPQTVNQLLQSNFGTIPKTKYKIKARYILPGGKNGTETTIDYEFK